jgi:hypothetical protein
MTYDPDRYSAGNWTPKEQRTVMQNPPEGMTVTRVERDFGATESDNTHLYVSKAQAGRLEAATSMQPRYSLVPVQTQHIANLQRVLFNSEADTQMRRNALCQLQTNVTERDCEESRAVLEQWQECGLSYAELND